MPLLKSTKEGISSGSIRIFPEARNIKEWDKLRLFLSCLYIFTSLLHNIGYDIRLIRVFYSDISDFFLLFRNLLFSALIIINLFFAIGSMLKNLRFCLGLESHSHFEIAPASINSFLRVWGPLLSTWAGDLLLGNYIRQLEIYLLSRLVNLYLACLFM